jgi:hypothetical protein
LGSLFVSGLFLAFLVAHNALLSCASPLRLRHSGLTAVLPAHVAIAFEVVFLWHNLSLCALSPQPQRAVAGARSQTQGILRAGRISSSTNPKDMIAVAAIRGLVELGLKVKN